MDHKLELLRIVATRVWLLGDGDTEEGANSLPIQIVCLDVDETQTISRNGCLGSFDAVHLKLAYDNPFVNTEKVLLVTVVRRKHLFVILVTKLGTTSKCIIDQNIHI